MKRFLCLLTVFISTSLPTFGAGFIILHGPNYWPEPIPPIRPGPPPRPVPPPRTWPVPPEAEAPLELTSLSARVHIDDQIATTTLEHEFYNPNSRQLEGTFLFPIPKGAQLDRFAMEINGQKVEAELLVADKARRIYEEIVRARKDPALLEYADRDVYKVRVFPITPHGKQHLTVSYTQVLSADDHLVSYVLPLAGNNSPRQLSVDLELGSRRPLKALYSPSHSVEIKRKGDREARVSFETSRGDKASDFELLFSRDEKPLAVNLLTHREGDDEDGYFLLLLNTSLDNAKVRPVPKDIIFVLDTSGSMAGPKLEQAKKALLFCIENLDREDRFDILRFSTEVESLFDKLSGADEDHLAEARSFVQKIKPTGGTAIASALDRALRLRSADKDRPFHIIFLTDGLPTVGVTDPDKIVESIQRKDNTRIFCFGIGTDVNTHLLDRVAETTHAVSQYVLPEEDLELKISGFYAKIREPALTNPELIFPEGMRVTKLYPSPLPDLFKGQQLVVVGRYRGHGDGSLKLKGTSQGESKTYEYDIDFPDRARDHDFLARLWATRRVGFLLDEIRLRGENHELKEEVTDLARRYGIVTPYTAYLILEDERERGVPLSRRSLPQLEQNVELSRDLGASYRSFAFDKQGDGAVAGARSSLALRNAQAPTEAIDNVNLEAARPKVAPSAAASTPAFQGRALAGGVAGADQFHKEIRDRAKIITTQTRFVAGRSFFRNDDQWIDTLSQQGVERKTRQIQFGSEEYFALVTEHPEVLPWLSLGTHVTFVLQDTVYSIHD